MAQTTAAARPRFWPALLIAAAFWLYFVRMQDVDMSMYPRFLLLMAGVGGFVLLLTTWWLTNGTISWRERWTSFLAVFILLAGTVAATFNALGPIGILLYFVPLLLTLLVMWLLLARRATPARRRWGMAIITALVLLPSLTLTTRGLMGDGKFDLYWRWSISPEQRYLAAAPPAPATRPAAQVLLTAGPADWPAFRGADRNARVTGIRIATDWAAQPPRQLWRQRIGPGWSSMAVVGNLLFTQEQRGEKEAVACFEATTGRQVWVWTENVRFDESMGGPGPRATPTFADGRLYTVGATGTLTCFQAHDGTVVWQRNIAKDAPAELPEWAFSGSPLVAHGLVIAFAGGKSDRNLLAYRSADGEPVWAAAAGSDSYSSPQLATLAGQEQVLLLGERGVAGFDLQTGKQLWEYAAPVGKGLTRSVQPQVVPGDRLLIGSEADFGTMLLAITRDGEKGWRAAKVWSSRNLKPDFNDFVVDGDYIYGFDGSVFACIDMAAGKRQWRDGRYGHGQVLLLADQHLLLVLAESGEVLLLRADPAGLSELGKFQAIEGKTWNHPALAGGRLHVRNGEEIAAYQLPVLP